MEDTAKTLSKYHKSWGGGKKEYAGTVTAFYDLVTDLYEYGWGQSFHFAPMKVGESFEESIANYEYFLGEAAGLKPGMKVLDLGCGVGGPQRALARKFGASIVGLNISEYQIGKCSAYNSKAGLDHLCSVLHGDFLNIPAEALMRLTISRPCLMRRIKLPSMPRYSVYCGPVRSLSVTTGA